MEVFISNKTLLYSLCISFLAYVVADSFFNKRDSDKIKQLQQQIELLQERINGIEQREIGNRSVDDSPGHEPLHHEHSTQLPPTEELHISDVRPESSWTSDEPPVSTEYPSGGLDGKDPVLARHPELYQSDPVEHSTTGLGGVQSEPELLLRSESSAPIPDHNRNSFAVGVSYDFSVFDDFRGTGIWGQWEHNRLIVGATIKYMTAHRAHMIPWQTSFQIHAGLRL